MPAGGANGILATQGGRFVGWSFLVMDGKPVFAYGASNQDVHKYRITSGNALTPGKHTVTFEFRYDGGGIGKGGTGTIFVDGQKVGEGRVDRTAGIRFSADETFDVGEDTGTPVVEEYAPMMPFRFTGNLLKLMIDLKPGF
jgi:arylsulfatase